MTLTRVDALMIGFGLWTFPVIALAQSTTTTTAPSATPAAASAVQMPDSSWSTATEQTAVPGARATATLAAPPPAATAPVGIASTASTGPETPSPLVSDTVPPPAPANNSSDEPPTLFGRKSVKVGGYGAIMVQYARINGRDGVLAGGEGALLLDHRFAIGLTGYGWSNEHRLTLSQNIDTPYMHFGYGGLLLRYHFYIPESPVLISAATLIGGGAVSLTQYWDSQVRPENADMFFIFEPQVGVHVNITRWMRVGLDAGYRVISGIGKFGFHNSDFDGVSVGGNIGFGWF